MRERQFLVHRADIDHFACALHVAAVPREALRRKERPRHVDADHGAVVFLGHVHKGGVLLDAGIVDQNVE